MMFDDSEKFIDSYEVFGIEYPSSMEEIKKVYHDLALKWHPDRFQDEEEKAAATQKMTLINRAYWNFKDPASKKAYDYKYKIYVKNNKARTEEPIINQETTEQTSTASPKDNTSSTKETAATAPDINFIELISLIFRLIAGLPAFIMFVLLNCAAYLVILYFQFWLYFSFVIMPIIMGAFVPLSMLYFAFDNSMYFDCILLILAGKYLYPRKKELGIGILNGLGKFISLFRKSEEPDDSTDEPVKAGWSVKKILLFVILLLIIATQIDEDSKAFERFSMYLIFCASFYFPYVGIFIHKKFFSDPNSSLIAFCIYMVRSKLGGK